MRNDDWKATPDTLAERFADAKAEIRRSGLRLSAGSWIFPELDTACAFSFEDGGPGTFGHPILSIHIDAR